MRQKFSEKSAETRYENLPVQIFSGAADASEYVAQHIAKKLEEKQSRNENLVLGLATGSSPISLYNQLIKLHQDGLSFSNVITFNLDEYWPMSPEAIQSYHRFMKEYLFNHLDIPNRNIHIPDGTISKDKVKDFCASYEKKIKEAGGIDIQILGIGRTGHIGFNEPGSFRYSKTRMITLDQITRIDAASDFFGEEYVPDKALTMGVGTIMESRKVYLMAWGEGKSSIIKRMVEGEVSESVPATYLQEHEDAEVILDEASSSELTRIKTPWLLKEHHWVSNKEIRKSVVWLCENLQKPVLKLTDNDYNDHGMSDLITEKGSAYSINIRIFNELQHTITGWPGGKPEADDTYRPERKAPFPKKVLIFSPHPDDDVISMGGTFIRLVDQGHEVHVAYQTSGNIAVFDDDVIRFVDFYQELDSSFNLGDDTSKALYEEVKNQLKTKKPGDPDSSQVRQIKGLIRKTEARAACRFVGIPEVQIHFLDLPFYETGLVKKNDIGEADIKIMSDLLQKIQPHQVFAAGDLSDPHGTHRVCLEGIRQAVLQVKNEKWYKDCWLWLYRGAWQEWDVHDIEMAVPLSPEELLRKRKAIFKHQSQKDTALFPGPDKREFWQRAEDRNRLTAEKYNQLGLAEYEAMEAFVRWHL